MLRDRKHAAYLLAQHLKGYKESDAVVVAIPHGGVPIGYHLADYLHLPLDIILSRPIPDPANSFKSIGSVSQAGIALNENIRTIPETYVYHQVVMIRSGLNADYKLYRGNEEPIVLTNRTIILVDDILTSENQILACLRSILKSQPKKLILAMPAIPFRSFQKIQQELCEICTLVTPSLTDGSEVLYDCFPKVSDEEVRQLLSQHLETSLMHT